MTCCAENGELQSVWWVLQRRSREWGPKAGEFGRWHLCAHGPGEASGAGAFVLARQGGSLASADTGGGHCIDCVFLAGDFSMTFFCLGIIL